MNVKHFFLATPRMLFFHILKSLSTNAICARKCLFFPLFLSSLLFVENFDKHLLTQTDKNPTKCMTGLVSHFEYLSITKCVAKQMLYNSKALPQH